MNRLRLPKPTSVPQERRRQVYALHEQGFNQPQIADIIGITQARVSQIMSTIEKSRTNKRHMLRLLPNLGASA